MSVSVFHSEEYAFLAGLSHRCVLHVLWLVMEDVKRATCALDCKPKFGQDQLCTTVSMPWGPPPPAWEVAHAPSEGWAWALPNLCHHRGCVPIPHPPGEEAAFSTLHPLPLPAELSAGQILQAGAAGLPC